MSALRAVGLFLVDLVVCLARMLLPAFWSAVALAVISLMGRVATAYYCPAFGGFVVGALAVCVVLCLLLWAQVRHQWWTP
ncbi:hypothetical protein Lesp02_84320 [Lentzea sp. NBRC 105346]|uniref:hypothetical protein n=1 Tax=Lentzea sp. NBRC 105346 TaxID=3032205 RepID=UPI0024A3E3D2|nr:hypothetical protein [Lentzea sp. NBRC 105346]GLZ36245.1 hypothetical protein Lesp02_84320 [Lentzea sp. NBRC 105346]